MHWKKSIRTQTNSLLHINVLHKILNLVREFIVGSGLLTMTNIHSSIFSWCGQVNSAIVVLATATLTADAAAAAASVLRCVVVVNVIIVGIIIFAALSHTNRHGNVFIWRIYFFQLLSEAKWNSCHRIVSSCHGKCLRNYYCKLLPMLWNVFFILERFFFISSGYD